MTRARGFTLLELMVALSLLTLLAGLMFGGFRIASRAWQTVNEHNSELSETVQAQRFLRRLLVHTETRTVAETRETSLLSFQGNNHSLIFLSTLPQRDSRASQPAWFYLALDRSNPEQPLLVLKAQLQQSGIAPEQSPLAFDWYQLVDDFQHPEAIPPIMILPAESFSLTYLPQEAGGMQADWQSDWQEQDTLPALVQLQLNEDWPALVVSPGEHPNVIKQTP